MDGLSHPAAGWRALPDPAPLQMPVQSLRQVPAPGPAARPSSPRLMGLRRLLVLGGSVLLTGFGAREMGLVLDIGSPTALQVTLLLLFVALFGWIALSFLSALAGFASLLGGGGRRLGIDPAGPIPELHDRTALLMPVYNEPPERVMAGLQAIHESLAATGRGAHFDIFILSDTTDPDAWLAEEEAFLALRDRTGDHAHIFYRRRPKNHERKAGNIAEWVQRFGAAYPQMLVLDADSVMEGDALVRLAAAMESHPDVGLIQTLPVIVNGASFFARMQQFAGRVYGPMIAAGIAWWHGAEGNYWGHNAIIRTRAFADHAGLPTLRGPRPFGGHILSHDFVEAALLRRAGWAVHMVPTLRGSYEESPPSLTDLAVRDRRWCQGNLQHAAVLPARGLHPISRLHLFTGIGSYITAPLWLLFLVVGVFGALEVRFIRPNYFPSGPSLFPDWPVVDPVRAMWLFIGTMSLLLVPKLLAWFLLLLKPEERRGIGGAVRSFLSMLVETLVAGLLAPVTMLTQSVDVASILTGRDSGWQPQQRDDGTLSWRAVFRLYWRHTLFGLLFGAASWLVSPYLALWMLPVTLGLALAVPLAALTARRGTLLRRLGLLAIPEESSPPAVLNRANSIRRRLVEQARPMEAVQRLAADPALQQAHLDMLPPPRRPRQDPLDPALLMGRAKLEEAVDLPEALSALTRPEKAAVLGDAGGVARLLQLANATRRDAVVPRSAAMAG
ncbi:glucans biosynthesis glucosyltransferase MdoH [Roseomonas frigidaquae]|uniref:Glucans biosynthesis glucosyltransferase H n=1 Tax=Falsiroseomonas frigidaquae TaxID=487318 RepID=A0ABX1F177_9PROT|nr:glucans biosynthesis glucosyltransferase MdoH [Falsiroseomonas frigidaquae]NKE46079.1 glucans biosynthesis glucosyltransferase MdoH [Falsiroseomonas frigidaquae]